MKNPFEINISFLSDLHISPEFNSGSWRMTEASVRLFEKSAKQAKESNPDLVMLMGDIFDAKHEALTELEFTQNVIKKGMIGLNWKILMGNHDARYYCTKDAYQKTDFFKAFNSYGPTEHQGYFKYEIPNSHYVVFGLDTSKNLHEEGWVEAEQLDWLEKEVESLENNKRAIVCMHHPVVIFNETIQDFDRMSSFLINDANALRKRFEKMKNIFLVVSGHTHTRGYRVVNGIHYFSVPSINSWPLEFMNLQITQNTIEAKYEAVNWPEMIETSKVRLLDPNSHYVEILKDIQLVSKYFGNGAKTVSVTL